MTTFKNGAKLQKVQLAMLDTDVQNKFSGYDTSLAQITPLKPSGGDDTNAIQTALNTYGKVKLDKGTFIAGLITIGANQSLVGSGIGLTTIQLKANANTGLVTMSDAHDSLLTDLTLDGNKSNNTVGSTTDSVLTIKASLGTSNFGLSCERIVIKNGANHGLYLPDNPNGNWVFHLSNITIMYCNKYGFYDCSTDNTFSNFYISASGWSNIYIDHAANNSYINFKMDYGGATCTSSLSNIDGANVIVRNGYTLRFSNIDTQSSYYVGFKLFDSYHIQLNNVNYDSNGLAYPDNNTTGYRLGLYLSNCHMITGSATFYNVATNKQWKDCLIDALSDNITITTESTIPSRVIINGFNCTVGSITTNNKKFDSGLNAINYFLDLYSSGNTAKLNGYNSARNKLMTADNLMLWVDGADFTNSPQTTTLSDRSGNGNNLTASGFSYTATSGSDGNGNIALSSSCTFSAAYSTTYQFKNTMTIDMKVNLPSIPDYNFLCRTESANGGGWKILPLGNKLYLEIKDSANNTYGFATYAIIPIDLNADMKITFVAEQNGTTIKVSAYKNGVFINSEVINQSSSNGIFDTNTNVFHYNEYGIVHKLKYFRVYSRALTIDEVVKNHNALVG